MQKIVIQLSQYGNVMVSKFESAAVASNQSNPERVCIAMLELMLNEKVRLCGIRNPIKVELFADVVDAISGTYINCEMRPQL
jgi:hypothetical protein